MVYRTLLKTIQKMQNSLTLRQQHFLYQRKNLYNQEPWRSSSGETAPENDYKISWLEFLRSSPSPDFIWGSGEAAGEAKNHAKRRLVGTIAIWKVKIRYRGRMSVWNNTGKMPSMCRGYGMLVRLSLWRAGKLSPLKPIVWGEAEFGRLVANKRMHGIENAAVSHSLHIDGIFRQI